MGNEPTDSFRAPVDFLYTYRRLLSDVDAVDEFHAHLREAANLKDRSALTERWIQWASGASPSAGPLSPEQNDAFEAFLQDPLLQPIVPWNQPGQALRQASASPDAPTPDDLRIIYRAMFASNDVDMSTAEFGKFETAAHAGRFADVEEQFTNLYRAQTGTTRVFVLSDEQRTALKTLTSDRYRCLSPFQTGPAAVY